MSPKEWLYSRGDINFITPRHIDVSRGHEPCTDTFRHNRIYLCRESLEIKVELNREEEE